MGGPDSLDAVEPYLKNIFNDPAIISIPLPNILRDKLAGWIAKKRVFESTEIYKKIGNKTPLTEISENQAALLEKLLNTTNSGPFSVFPAMRYWHPFVEDVWEKITADGYEKIVVLSLYPFYSFVTSGSLIDLVNDLQSKYDMPDDRVVSIDRFGNNQKFIAAIAEQINQALKENPDFKDVLLSAHSIPMRSIKKGDPYRDEIERHVNRLQKLLPDDVYLHLAFQSKIGPVKWLGPSTPDKITELAEKGVNKLLACPLGFIADNSETIYEIGMLYKDFAEEKGIEHFIRIDSLNTNDLFIQALKEIVLEKL